MACPYFRPCAPMGAGEWSSPPRLPLVDPYLGTCEAGLRPVMPDVGTQRECCNRGYARGRCSHFPAGAIADAVRFTAGESGEISWVVERLHCPVEHGRADSLKPGSLLAAQADAFAGAWNRRPRRREAVTP